MLEKIDLNQKVGKKEYKSEMKKMEVKLGQLQQTMRDKGIPVIIAFEGFSASGKGTLIGRITYPLDPRHFNVYTMSKVNEEKFYRPTLWSYWTKTPSAGRMTIFDKSWHRAINPNMPDKWKLSEEAKAGFYYDVNSFEQQLSDSGVLILKFFIYISKEEQKKRFDALEKDAATKWRVNEQDIKQNKEYEKNLKHFENMIHETSTAVNEWNIIEANDIRYATLKVYRTIISKIENEIARKDAEGKEKKPIAGVPVEVSILSSVNLNKKVDPDEYKEKLQFYQEKIAYLGYKLYTKRKSVVIAYEGWDAAGKGGNIKRLTEELDPRSYEVVPIAAPSKEELSHHYLWRFWNKMPKDGHFAIFDRTWYGRVMVERVEGFTPEEDWSRAYREINDMELHMANHGTIIFKFWLHIDKDEQLERFHARQNDPLKQFKITDEDWRNRDKWDEYEKAVDEMLFRTDTDYAPWTIIESNDKKYARLKTLEIVCGELEKRLK